ncbi:FkbM family methyltransferase [Arcicella rosea]|uniref:FkbM family methyltransferase n=1 Tax=Arcicella rosea TaxID=502909 RepID=UPI00345DB119
MFVLKYILKGPYHAFRTPESRELLKLFRKYGDVKRYEAREVTFQGMTFQVPDCMSFLFQFQEIFVEQFYKFNTNSANPVILDCGANIGSSCAFFKREYPNAQITAFEADAKIATILQSNLSKNGFSDVEVINKAVWIDDEGIEFASEGSDGASIYGEGDKVKVASFRLKDVLDKTPSVDMLKMDIEGAETAVLKDCTDSLKQVKNIFIEYHAFPEQAQELGEILNILAKNGFRYFINSAQDRTKPLVNHRYKGNDLMDLQLNIFGYRP